MSKPKTHRERAERAAKLIHSDAVPEWTRHAVESIAEEMYPEELVEAAKGLLNEVESNPKHSGMTLVYLEKARAALALYKEER